MNSQTLNIISYILLGLGVLFLILTIIFSVKFKLVSIIKSELGNKKKRKTSESEDYFSYVENKNKDIDIEEVKTSPSYELTENTIQEVYSDTDEEERDESSSTVIVSQRRINDVSEGTVIVSSRSRNAAPKENSEEFVITENIMIINGDPHAVRV